MELIGKEVSESVFILDEPIEFNFNEFAKEYPLCATLTTDDDENGLFKLKGYVTKKEYNRKLADFVGNPPKYDYYIYVPHYVDPNVRVI